MAVHCALQKNSMNHGEGVTLVRSGKLGDPPRDTPGGDLAGELLVVWPLLIVSRRSNMRPPPRAPTSCRI